MVMKNSQKILPFPKPPEDPGAQTIIFQIGNERFAIHYEIEDLPPAAPLLQWKQRAKTALPKTVKKSVARSYSCPPHGLVISRRKSDQFVDHRVAETTCRSKHRRLPSPVTVGSRFGDWPVCWLGSWEKHQLYFLAMLVRITDREA